MRCDVSSKADVHGDVTSRSYSLRARGRMLTRQLFDSFLQPEGSPAGNVQALEVMRYVSSSLVEGGPRSSLAS